MRFNKKRKNIDAIASTSYGQTLNGQSSFYTIPCYEVVKKRKKVSNC